MSAMSVVSPCVSTCRINPRTGLCEGCRRTLTEIAEWLAYTDDEKRAIIAALADREPFGEESGGVSRA